MFVKIREVCYIRRETNFSYTVGQVCLEYERMIHQGNRSDLTGNHLGITAEQVGRKFNVSGRTVSRYIRLAQLDIEKIEEIKEGLFTNKDVPKCEACPYNTGLNSGQKFPCGLQKCYISMFYNSYSEKLRSSS